MQEPQASSGSPVWKELKHLGYLLLFFSPGHCTWLLFVYIFHVLFEIFLHYTNQNMVFFAPSLDSLKVSHIFLIGSSFSGFTVKLLIVIAVYTLKLLPEYLTALKFLCQTKWFTIVKFSLSQYRKQAKQDKTTQKELIFSQWHNKSSL